MMDMTDVANAAGQRHVDGTRFFWLSWALATAIGWAVGGAAFVAAAEALASVDSSLFPELLAWTAGMSTVAMALLVSAIPQWLLLRRYLGGAGWWLATMPAGGAGAVLIGNVVRIVIGVSFSEYWGWEIGWIVGVISFGTTLGVAQWLALRPRVYRAGMCVAISNAGWIVAGASALLAVGRLLPPLPFDAFWIVSGAAYGAVTGPGIAALLRRRR